ncbi:MAG: hypothetical protein K2N24_09165 [Lachnospiraceae bacterium]|nr:hypothetical protein [Lachnospiraceae bacterium]
MTTLKPTTREPYRYEPDPREFAGELTVHDFSTCYPNAKKKYAYTNKELEIRAAYYKNLLAVNPWQQ